MCRNTFSLRYAIVNHANKATKTKTVHTGSKHSKAKQAKRTMVASLLNVLKFVHSPEYNDV